MTSSIARWFVELKAFGLCERPLEVMVWGVGGDIQQCAVHRRYRYALVVGGVLGIEGTSTVQADPRDPVPGRGGGHFGAGRVVLQEPPVHCRAEVTEHRTLPAGQHCRQPPAFAPQHGVADRVDAAM
jgi:hypothetical protein